jgi:hypothetical protein
MIDKGEFVVMGKIWLLRQGKKWHLNLHWHTECWLKQGIEAIKEKERTQPKIEKRGRPALTLNEADYQKRHKVMMRRGSILQRIRVEMSIPDTNFDKIVHLGAMLDKCRKELESLGGCPKDW